MNKDVQEKLEKIVALVDNISVDPDIEIEYCAPDMSDDPYILLTYVVSQYDKPTRKVRLGNTMLLSSVEEIVNQITASIEEFKSEIDSVEMG
ncbi:MAG: hypothetical protein Q8J85_00460 [Sulfuricurvum sp.]|nr:hypothetical protein [Sulfuricurvum sp.]MDP3021842.1 hypothetical protein [Sulfuricurvum sp.]